MTDTNLNIHKGGLRTLGKAKSDSFEFSLITIITVVFNGEEHIEDTIKSVLKQSWPNVEYIIVDGGSTDRTLDIIKYYEQQIDYWVSESDNGIYDAMNKAILLSSGEFISLVNADDFLMDDALSEALSVVSLKTDVLLTNGNFQTLTGDYTYESNIDKLKYTMSVFHPGMIVRKRVYEKVGLYRTDLKIASDYDWILRAHNMNIQWQHANVIYSTMREGGISADYALGTKEMYQIQREYTPILAKILYFLRRVKAYLAIRH
ncbi:glycosyltransferase family 2 protein [Thiomicrorhabdus sp. Milos-T2]|uniref:glycosyltransferase family 2 protein n=1 Tax=Thiomicrorhabdus sp. Milos-T2 TaxID=90814 RepID=UPI00068B5633|nr:glycosyltransferase family 2 protein [Thiomicrorhabdus sp. Milos-T2]